ncbi:MAG: cytochrome C554 [Calditrichae bacterium]|nr:cytochrome C554 [Calditrichia bacterium]
MFAQEEAKKGEEKYSYIGVDMCKICHRKPDQGEQFKIWENSKHSKAYETLKTEQAVKVAKEQGIEAAPHEAPECLKCHVTAFGVDESRLGSRFDKAAGVQCETCHGPGSEYKSRSIMQDREKAIANGMRAIAAGDGTAKELCVSCHNEESPTFKGFDFEEMWPKIAHPVPAEEG